MAKIHTYQQLNLKKQTEQTRRTETIMDTESVLMVASWKVGVEGMGAQVRGLGSTDTYRVAVGIWSVQDRK